MLNSKNGAFFPKNGLLLKNFYLIFLKYVKIRDVITIKVLPKTIKEIEAEYNDYIIERNVGYILYVIKKDDTIITAYDNTKRSSFKITIQGPESQELASKYAFQPQLLPKKIKQDKDYCAFIEEESYGNRPQIETSTPPLTDEMILGYLSNRLNPLLLMQLTQVLGETNEIK